ncbi:MAG TPA: hypothetical protein PLB59_04495 [Bacteroidales bacterium]|jgi:hypothetical protein|nr:hypothetical protein [Bacteroidales bacterium]HNZ42753.1 hypothetical protein [Bacteroidales bacterium]HPB24923.1 hypothetical protein [Bacteroidales bacterium]HPI29905.1 hypothetical protein [Bacteroidales bacterium]HQN15769.1 hypothetical protein [Bacteroidales bacterium]
MKNTSIKILLTSCLLVVPLFITNVLAQVPPPAPSGNSAPIDGLGIMAVLALLYGVRKLKEKRK